MVKYFKKFLYESGRDLTWGNLGTYGVYNDLNGVTESSRGKMEATEENWKQPRAAERK
ncbi:15753_t:CDS:2 [Cetraspora pellucida]|uniref:15753_t:CDS:1 n=1 Tax=Cetraspora pellucida TaxID=1433469 RepID=A0A9N9CCH9_9GLOM|nr:15753_t:CDS:2 [Cetraspora pellucida]